MDTSGDNKCKRWLVVY